MTWPPVFKYISYFLSRKTFTNKQKINTSDTYNKIGSKII